MCDVLHVGDSRSVFTLQTSTTSLNAKHRNTSGLNGWCHSPCLAPGELTQTEAHLKDDAEEREFDCSEEKRRKVNGCGNVVIMGHQAENLQKSHGNTMESVNFVALLKACTKQKDLQQGSKLHDDIMRMGLLENNVFIGSALVCMYARCGALEKAQLVFDMLTVRNVVLWTALITGYVHQGYGKKALECFEQMRLEGCFPNAITLSCILKACGQIRDLGKGEEVHVEIMRENMLGEDVVVASALVDMYVKCGALAKAQAVFDEMPTRNVVSWNVLITGYAQYERGKEAIECFQSMQLDGLFPNSVTLASIVKACGSVGDLEKGKELHAQIVRERLLEKDLVIGTALVDMYCKCGEVEKAQEVFDHILVQDIFLWNALIAGYDQQRGGEEALRCFEQMQLRGSPPDSTTFTFVLNACGSIGALDKGQAIHAQIVRDCVLEERIEVANALVDMYVKCGALGKAKGVFDELSCQNLVSWNALIAGYTHHRYGEEAVKCYEQMQLNGLAPNAITFACILKACGSVGALDKGQEIHVQIVMDCLLEEDVMVGTALVDLYARCGALGEAREVFKELTSRNVVSWNALIAGYVQHGQGEEALNCIEEMQHEGFSPDAITFICILKACGSIGAVYKGQVLHSDIVRHGAELGSIVAVALLDMYASCGMLAEALYLFDRLPERDTVSWSALLGGYSQLGKDDIVVSLYDRMVGESIHPNSVIFAVLLNVCSHRGLLEKGESYFEIISKDYGVTATLEHQTSLIDLYGRTGHLEKAVALAEKISTHADLTMWHTLLGACQKWGNAELGRWAFEQAIRLCEKDAAVFVSMSNIAADKIDSESRGEAMEGRKHLVWRKRERSWWMDTMRVTHAFCIGDQQHPQIECIHARLVHISKKLSQEGFSSALGIFDNVEGNVSCDHAEKLAMACALINVPKVAHVHIVKNMQMCHDCHSATSLVSRIEKCSISVKDAVRLHIFDNGRCKCLDPVL